MREKVRRGRDAVARERAPMRLIDDIRRDGRLQMPWWVEPQRRDDWLKYAEKVVRWLKEELPVLLIDNVADYYYVGTTQETWNLTRDFPNLSPPFPAFWCEHRVPRAIRSENGDVNLVEAFEGRLNKGRVGWLILAADRKDVVGDGIPADTRWVLCGELFIDCGDIDGILGPHGSWLAAIDEHGAMIGAPHLRSYAPESANEAMQAQMTWIHPTLLAVSFLHCRNVSIVDNAVPPKLARRTRERHGIEPTAYKTLVIEPLKQVLRHEGRSHETGLANAMHICRGHFKDYREGRGLFGKYHQVVWQPSIVRGTKHRDDKTVPAREISISLKGEK
jgi:hypothetical protein